MKTKYAITEPAMLHHRDGDGEGVNTILRSIDWKWMCAIVVSICGWGANQWVQYNALQSSFQQQTTAVTKLTATVELLSNQINATNSENLKQDFGITRLKERLDIIESWKNQIQVAPLPSTRR